MRSILIILILFIPVSFLSAQTKKKASPQPSAKAFHASIERGKAVYIKTCIACHQADGNGVPRLNPPLSKTEYVLGDKTRLIEIILNGLNEEIEINGDYYSNPMPPFNTLSDQEIADVLTYIRNNFQNKASAVTASEVKTVRAADK
jgi:mono/diheme cytochrome c family protein